MLSLYVIFFSVAPLDNGFFFYNFGQHEYIGMYGLPCVHTTFYLQTSVCHFHWGNFGLGTDVVTILYDDLIHLITINVFMMRTIILTVVFRVSSSDTVNG